MVVYQTALVLLYLNPGIHQLYQGQIGVLGVGIVIYHALIARVGIFGSAGSNQRLG